MAKLMNYPKFLISYWQVIRCKVTKYTMRTGGGYAIAFSLLMGCALNSTANQLTPSYPHSEISNHQIAQHSENPLSTEQLSQLRSLDMRVIVPTYVPAGFELTELKIYKGSPPDQRTRPDDVPFYWMIFQGENNTCFRLMSGNQGFRDRPQNRISVNTKSFGTITVDYGKSQSRPEVELIQAGIPLPESYRLDSGINPNTPCKPMPVEEYIKVLQSIEFL